jgi:hypothetical protein
MKEKNDDNTGGGGPEVKNGKYKTKAGSTLSVSGEHGGIYELDFDWVEEGACCDCKPDPVPYDGYLVWYCEICGGGKAKWEEGVLFMECTDGSLEREVHDEEK